MSNYWADNFQILDTWKNYKEILYNYDIYVVPRDGHDITETLEKYISQGYNNIHYLNDITPLKISSTEVRKRIKEGKLYDSLVPYKVAKYIKENNPYNNDNNKLDSLKEIILSLEEKEFQLLKSFISDF